MQTTFIMAQKLNVSPFDIMAQDVDAVILVVNYLLESIEENNTNVENNNLLSEKERDSEFWSAL